MPITLDVKKNWFLREVFEKGERRGREAGRVEGREEGISIGEANLLQRQLERRFGPLPEWVFVKFQTADRNTLEIWGLRLLEVEHLEDVLR